MMLRFTSENVAPGTNELRLCAEPATAKADAKKMNATLFILPILLWLGNPPQSGPCKSIKSGTIATRGYRTHRQYIKAFPKMPLVFCKCWVYYLDNSPVRISGRSTHCHPPGSPFRISYRQVNPIMRF